MRSSGAPYSTTGLLPPAAQASLGRLDRATNAPRQDTRTDRETSERSVDPVLHGLIEKFEELDRETQSSVIEKLEKEGEDELAETLKKLRRIEKRNERMDSLINQILDSLE